MFGGMTDFDQDPESWGDLNGIRRPSTAHMAGQPFSGMGQDVAGVGPPEPSWHQQDIPGLSAGGIASVFRAASRAIGAGQAAGGAQRLQEANVLRQQHAGQQAQHKLQMQQMGPMQFQQSMFSRYGTVLFIVAILAAGGIAVYMSKKRRK